MNKLKKFSISKLLDNNKFVFAISLILAFAIWLGYSMYGGEQQERTIDVPIQMDSMTVPNQFNLQQFGEYSNTAVSVTIVGKKSVIGTVNDDDIKVTASTLDVNTAGKHTLPLSVSIDSSKEFQIVSTNTLSVEVYFDVYKEVSVKVTPDLSVTPTVPEGFELGNIILSDNKLLAHGPSTEVSKIDKILASAEIDETLQNTKTYSAVISAVDKYGNEIQNIDIDDSEGFKITIPVFKLAKLPVDVEITNIPDGISKEDLNITYSVKELNVAGEAKTVDNLSALSVGTIDFSELKNTKNVFRFDPGAIAGIKLKSDVETVVVTIDLSSFKSKEVTVPASAIEMNNATALKATITDKNISVTVAGNSDALQSIAASDFSVSAKIDEKMTAGEGKKAELTVMLPDVSGVWVIGSYTVTVSLE